MASNETYEACFEMASICVDEVLMGFEGESFAPISPNLVEDVKAENIEVASVAIDNILGEFEMDLGASGGSVGDIENKGDRVNLDRKKPKTPPKKDKKVRGVRRPKVKYKEGVVAEEFVMKPLKPAPPVPNSRFLKERETKRQEEEKLAQKAKKRVAKMKREKKLRELKRKAEILAEQKALTETLEMEVKLRQDKAKEAERRMEEERKARAKALEEKKKRLEMRKKRRSIDNSSSGVGEKPPPLPSARGAREGGGNPLREDAKEGGGKDETGREEEDGKSHD
eukprot:CAMPEP_0118648776 /NCGR_PEP_ID=MMETSP0785-20121206/9344_1 /TAXON_ID=91992 /ORGANISM="Bolidomonas pacifica, Strain CCMP 1866" /LENGTH=281 /DNA_ID=CAMNT_0006541007 /DNA_START=106 /DNA_END=951 /DNA_ORIENTATION=-